MRRRVRTTEEETVRRRVRRRVRSTRARRRVRRVRYYSTMTTMVC